MALVGPWSSTTSLRLVRTWSDLRGYGDNICLTYLKTDLDGLLPAGTLIHLLEVSAQTVIEALR
jgi:hypothetical protein